MTAEEFLCSQFKCEIAELHRYISFMPTQIPKLMEAYHKAEVEDKISKLTNKHYNRLRNSQGDAECRRLLKEQLLKQ